MDIIVIKIMISVEQLIQIIWAPFIFVIDQRPVPCKRLFTYIAMIFSDGRSKFMTTA